MPGYRGPSSAGPCGAATARAISLRVQWHGYTRPAARSRSKAAAVQVQAPALEDGRSVEGQTEPVEVGEERLGELGAGTARCPGPRSGAGTPRPPSGPTTSRAPPPRHCRGGAARWDSGRTGRDASPSRVPRRATGARGSNLLGRRVRCRRPDRRAPRAHRWPDEVSPTRRRGVRHLVMKHLVASSTPRGVQLTKCPTPQKPRRFDTSRP